MTAAEKNSREKLEASIARSAADAKARQAAFKATVEQRQAAAASQWEELQEDFQHKTQQIKNKIETEKEAREVKKANRRAEDAASYAAAALYFSLMATDEAELALLEAVSAQVYANC